MSKLTESMTEEKLAAYFDHTCLQAYAVKKDFEKICEEAIRYGFNTVAVNEAQVSLCKELLKGSSVGITSSISFPLGQETLASKVYSTKDVIAEGATNVDYVINIGKLKDKDYVYIKKEMEEIVAVCRENNVISKVIFETCYLEKDEIKELALIAREVGPDFVKTSTGFGPDGAKAEDVRLMKETVGDKIKVKAAGKVRTLEDAYAMIEAGAERIGSTASVKIMEEFKRSKA